MGLRAFGAIGDLGLSVFWSLGQTGLRAVGTKEPFEALGHIACTVYGIQHIWSTTHIYYAILRHIIPYYVILFNTTLYYSINRDTQPRLAIVWIL